MASRKSPVTLKSTSRVLPLPELILHAVTESASILTLRQDGAVLWSADALVNLARALGNKFAEISLDEEFVKEFVNMLYTDIGQDKDMETEVAPKLILMTLMRGTGTLDQ